MLKLKAWNSARVLLVRDKHTRVQAFFEIQPLRRWKRDKFSFFSLPKDNHIFISIEAREFGVRVHGILDKNENEWTRVWTVFEIQLLKGVQTDDNKRYVKKKALVALNY